MISTNNLFNLISQQSFRHIFSLFNIKDYLNNEGYTDYEYNQARILFNEWLTNSFLWIEFSDKFLSNDHILVMNIIRRLYDFDIQCRIVHLNTFEHISSKRTYITCFT